MIFSRFGHRIIVAVAALLILAPLLSRAADRERVIPPPLVPLFPTEISNTEILYLGGTATAGDATVLVYVQSEDGDVFSREVKTASDGTWFYTHGTFLKRGAYDIWTQLKVGDSLSPPSSKIRVTVAATALQIGSLRFSYERFFMVLTVILLMAIVALAASIAVHWRRLRRKQADLAREIKEAEEAVRRGFELLHKDIMAEIELLKGVKMSRELSREEREQEEKLLKDLGMVEHYVYREVSDIERALGGV